MARIVDVVVHRLRGGGGVAGRDRGHDGVVLVLHQAQPLLGAQQRQVAGQRHAERDMRLQRGLHRDVVAVVRRLRDRRVEALVGLDAELAVADAGFQFVERVADRGQILVGAALRRQAGGGGLDGGANSKQR